MSLRSRVGKSSFALLMGCGARIAVAALMFIAVGLGLNTQAASAQDKQVTCQITTEQVLKPFIDSLNAALAAQDFHAESTAARVERQSKYIADMKAARPLYEAKHRADIDYHETHIAYAQQAIRDIARNVAKQLHHLSDQRNAAVAAGNENLAKQFAKQILELRARFAAGKESIHSAPLGFGGTTTSWRVYISQEQDKLQAVDAKHKAGDVGIHLSLLGYTATWNGVLKLIADEEVRRADTQARKDSFHMPSLGYSLTGEKVDLLVKQRRDALADAKARIAAGTFMLHIPTFGFTADRNYALEQMGKAKASLEEVRAGWGNGKFARHNDLVGYTIAKADIDKNIEKLQTELAAYSGLGDGAQAWVKTAGYNATGLYIREQHAAAKTAEKKHDWDKHLQSWRNGRTARIDKFNKDIAHWQAVLTRHSEIWDDAIAKIEEDIAGRLTRALAETPCGGGTADAALVDRQRSVLAGLSETDDENFCRQAVYDDRVYVTPDGVRHGSVRDAMLAALADTAVLDPGTVKADPPKSLEEKMAELKGFSDWLLGWADSAGIVIDRVRVSRITSTLEALEGKMRSLSKLASKRGMTKAAFSKARAAHVRDVTEAMQAFVDANGYFLSSDFTTVIGKFESKSLGRAAGKSREIRSALSKLRDMQRTAAALNGSYLPRFAGVVRNVGKVTQANLDAASAAINTVRQGRIRETISGMSGVERGLLVFAIAAAAAEASDLVNKGMSPLEAVPRAGVNLTVELGIGAVPITAAAHAASLLIFETAARITGDDVYREINVENTAKALAQRAVDEWASIAASVGEATAESDVDLLIDTAADRATIEKWLGVAETRLDGVEPGSPRSKGLLRSRARLRALLRARLRAEEITDVRQALSDAQYARIGMETGSEDFARFTDAIKVYEARLAALQAREC